MPGTAYNIPSFTELARDPEGFFSIKYRPLVYYAVLSSEGVKESRFSLNT